MPRCLVVGRESPLPYPPHATPLYAEYGDLRGVAVCVDGYATTSITNATTLGNVFLNAANSVFDLGFSDLVIKSPEHPLVGEFINYGTVRWTPFSTLILIR